MNADTPKEMVNHPAHYNSGMFEAIDVIEDVRAGFNDGNALKYLLRYRHKHKEPRMQLEDIDKATWYAMRERDRVAKEIGEPPKFDEYLKSKKYERSE